MARLTRKHGESKIEIGVGIQAAPDWADLRWPDFYVGYDRADNFASHGGEIWHKRPAYLSKLAEGLFRRIQELLRFDGRLPVTSG